MDTTRNNRGTAVTWVAFSLGLIVGTAGFFPWVLPDRFEDRNSNGEWDAPEPFTDSNGNGQWDQGESFADLDGDGEYDEGDWYDPVLTGYGTAPPSHNTVYGRLIEIADPERRPRRRWVLGRICLLRQARGVAAGVGEPRPPVPAAAVLWGKFS